MTDYRSMAVAAANRYGVPPDLFMRVIQQESSWNPLAQSSAGAFGLAQLMPGTASDLGVDPHDPAQNLDGGARYLAQQYKTFGDWGLALAAYNAGPGNVRKHGGIPPFRETQNYVSKIMGGQPETAEPDNALAALQPEAPQAPEPTNPLADVQRLPQFNLWQGHDPRMFMSRRTFG